MGLYLKLLVVLLVGVPRPPTLNVVAIDGLIDVAGQVVKRHLGVAIYWPAHIQHTQSAYTASVHIQLHLAEGLHLLQESTVVIM